MTMSKTNFFRRSVPAGLFLLMFAFVSYQNSGVSHSETKSKSIPITWKKEISEDFSFTEDWSYPEGVYRNQYGQLSCDGFCSNGIDAMTDSTGRIYKDSLDAFYSLVDTTHQYHNFVADGFMYEWAGSNQILFERTENEIIHGYSAFNAATHNSIHFEIQGDSVSSWLEYVGIVDGNIHRFLLKEGQFELDKKLFRKGWIKAKFNMEYVNHLEELVPLSCEGKIYAKIN